MGGFECSTQRRHDNKRLDLTRSSGHEQHAAQDYAALSGLGLKGARDGLRWYLIEQRPGVYDWSSFLPLLRAAHQSGVRVAWDLCHYGWPDDIDIWRPEFVQRFARFAGQAARLVEQETGEPPIFCPVNEISFWSWAGGNQAAMNPNARGRGQELKRQLVRASLAAIDAVRQETPRARILHAEPAIHVDGGAGSRKVRKSAEAYRVSQFEALDMIAGTQAPELGGRPDCLDVVGVNFYPHNQWYLGGSTIPMGHHAYRPLAAILAEVFARYGRPILITETGAEGSARPAWLHYVVGEVIAARSAGVPVEGICLYPVLDTEGWVDHRICPVGLFSSCDAQGARTVYMPLLEEIEYARSKIITRALMKPPFSVAGPIAGL
nr:beta-glucosidase [Mesorhizobium liriopis]